MRSNTGRRASSVSPRLPRRALVALVALVVLASCASAPSVPGWVVWQTRDATCDGHPVRLEQQRVTVWQDNPRQSMLCASPNEWLVQDLVVTDLNRDGNEDLLMLCWRMANFGSSRPFWRMDEKDEEWTQHLFLVQPAEGALRPVWMTSDIGAEVEGLRKVGERVELTSRSGSATLWEWQTWGLTLVENNADVPSSAGTSASTTRGAQVARHTQAHTQAPVQDPQTLSILAAGDVLCHASMYQQACTAGNGTPQFDFLFTHVAPFVSAHDIALVNQETILVSDRSQVSFYPLFGTPDTMGDALVQAGFDVVCAATNHAADKGARGIEHTCSFWRTQHPATTLLGLRTSNNESTVTFLEKKGYTLALLNATEHLNGQTVEEGSPCSVVTLNEQDRLLAEVAQAERTADLTLCMLHVGEEYESQPSPTQRAAVEKFVDAGADVVICAHPHVLLPCESVRTPAGNEAVVYWSLGNLVSNQMDLRTVLGGMASLVIARNDAGNAVVRSFELVPTVCHFEPSTTSAYLLEDYSLDLALRHTLTQELVPYL